MKRAEAYQRMVRRATSVASEILGASEVSMVLHSNEDKDDLLKLLSHLTFDLPVQVIIKKAESDRSLSQNNLQYVWFKEAERQGDMKAWEYRAYCKLHHGVPILRRDSKAYADKYDQFVKPLPYETKIAYMVEPFDFPVTKLFTVAQMREYLDAVKEHLTGLGMQLTHEDSLI